MSRSVSAPPSVTKTSPCWNGFMVPGSTLRYGSSFCIVTRSPRALSRLLRLDAVRPLPSEEATPPVTNRCLVACATPTDHQAISAPEPFRRSRPRHRRVGARPGAVVAAPTRRLLGQGEHDGDPTGREVGRVDRRHLRPGGGVRADDGHRATGP